MKNSDATNIQPTLLTAIENKDSEQVLELLQKGANPNGEEGQESPPLLSAIRTFDQNDIRCTAIIKNLLCFGADPLADFEDNWSSSTIYEYAAEYHYNFECLKIIFYKLAEEGRCNLSHIVFAEKIEILNFYFEHGIVAGALEALERCVDPIDCHEDNFFISKILPELYEIAKSFYQLNLKININKINPDTHNTMFMLSLEQRDYSFTYSIIKNKYSWPCLSSLTTKSENCLLYLLSDDNQHYSDSMICLLLHFLRKNYTHFYASIYDKLPTNASTKKISPQLIIIAGAIDAKFYTAIAIFLNPLQDTFNEYLTLQLRLKLAITYLRNEFDFLRISDEELTAILLARCGHFAPHHLERIKTNFFRACSGNNIIAGGENKGQKFQEIKQSIFNAIINDIPEFIVDPKLRHSLTARLRLIQLSPYCTDSDFKNTLLLHIGHWKKNYYYTCHYNTLFTSSYASFYFQIYSLYYAIKTHNPDLFSIFIKKNTKKNTAEENRYFFKCLYPDIKNFIATNPYVTDLQNSDETWFINQLLYHSITLNDPDILNELLIKSQNYFNANIKGYITFSLNNHFYISASFLVNFLKFSNISDQFWLFATAFQEKNHFFLLQENKIEHSLVSVDALSNWFRVVLVQQNNYPLFLSFLNYFSTIPKLWQEKILSDILIKLSDHYKITRLPYLLQLISQVYPELKHSIHHLEGIEAYRMSIALTDKVKRIYINNVTFQICNRKAAEYLLSHNPGQKQPKNNLFSRLGVENYRLLKERLLTNANVSTLEKSKALLTDDEAALYTTLISCNWKLTHFVKSNDDLKNIILQKEIQSVLYRRRHYLPINNIHTPTQLHSEGHIFFTLGPEKSPQPYFLKDCAGVEIDVKRLLKKFPRFFNNAIATNHWFSVKTNQTVNATSIMGVQNFISHAQGRQYNEYISHDSSVMLNSNTHNSVYTGKRLIHILCLLFIEKIRKFGSFYNHILSKNSDIEFLSNVFCTIMHPGVIEIRYPHKLTLDDSFFRILKATPPTFYTDTRINDLLDDESALLSALEAGYDPCQLTSIIFHKNGESNLYYGNLLTKAILHGKKSVINFFIENRFVELQKTATGVITPLNAVDMVGDYDTLFRLITVGVPSNENKIIRHLALPDKDLLLKLFKHLSIEKIAVVLRCIPRYLRNDLLLIYTHILFYDANTKNISIIKHLINAGIDNTYKKIYSEHDVLPPLFKAAFAKNKEIILLLLEQGFDPFEIIYDEINTVTLTIFKEENAFIELMLDKFPTRLCSDNEGAISPIVLLSISKSEALFRKFMITKFSHICENMSYEDLLHFLVKYYCEKSTRSLERTITEVFKKYEESSWIDRNKFHQFFVLLWSTPIGRAIILNTQRDEPISYLAAFEGLPDTNINCISIVLKNRFIHFDFLIGQFVMRGEQSIFNPDEVEKLFNLVKPFPHFALHVALSRCPALINKNIQFILGLLFRNDSHQIHHSQLGYLLRKLDLNQLDEFIAKLFLESSTLSIIHLLALLIDEHPSTVLLRRFIDNTHFNQFVNKNLRALLNDIDTFDIHDNVKNKLRIILFEICPTFEIHSNPIHSAAWATELHMNTFLTLYCQEDLPALNEPNFDRANLKVVGAALITCLVQGKPHIYLGKKKSRNTVSPLLMPGGFIESTDVTPFLGMLREIKEETTLDLVKSLATCTFSSIGIINAFLENFQKFTHCRTQIADKSPIPVAISLLHRFTGVKHLDRFLQKSLRTMYFYWIEFDFDIRSRTVPSDDFTDGIWVPLSEIQYSANVDKYYFKDQEILKSNGMLIDLLNNKIVSFAMIKDQLEKESLNKTKSNKDVAILSFLNEIARKDTALPSKQETPPLKRPNEAGSENSPSKRQCP